MQTPNSKAAVQALLHDRRDEFVAAVEAALPLTAVRLESIALFATVAVLWGVIVYAAISTIQP